MDISLSIGPISHRRNNRVRYGAVPNVKNHPRLKCLDRPYSAINIISGATVAWARYNVTANTAVSAGAQGVQEGVTGAVANANTLTSQPFGTSGAVGVQGIGACSAAGCTATWGAVASGQANPPNELYGLEVDNYAHGTDTNLERIGIQIVAATPDGLGTVNTVGRGLFSRGTVRFTPGSTST